MAGTLIQNGETISGTTPTGGYTNGQLIEMTDIVGIVNDAYAAGATFVAIVDGVWQITKTPAATNVFTQGDSVYVTSTGAITNVSTSNQFVGIAWAAATTTASSVNVRINWGG